MFYQDELTDEEKSVVKWLEERSGEAFPYSNYVVRSMDLSEEEDVSLEKLRESDPEAELPWVVIRFPRTARIESNLWAGPLMSDTIQAIPISPKRQEVAKRILQGDTSVWLFLESGNEEKDEQAYKLLEEKLQMLEKKLKLPEQPYDTPAYPDSMMPEEDELKIQFSILRLSRAEQDEELLVNMLMQSEWDLGDYSSEPMAFPIYGRGRILYALVGEGINEDNVIEACLFLTGPCSCMAKDMNPGTDMLMSVDWDAALQNKWVDAFEEAEFFGLTTPVSNESVAELTSGETSSSSTMIRNILLALGILIVINGFIAFRIIQKRSQS